MVLKGLLCCKLFSILSNKCLASTASYGKEFHSFHAWRAIYICSHSASLDDFLFIYWKIQLIPISILHSHDVTSPLFLPFPYTISFPSCRVLACLGDLFHTVQLCKHVMLLHVRGNPSYPSLMLWHFCSLWGEVPEWLSVFSNAGNNMELQSDAVSFVLFISSTAISKMFVFTIV